MSDVTPIAKKRKKPYSSTQQNKRVATDLHAKIVRARGYCEWGARLDQAIVPCSGRLECAHIIRRGWAATRTDLDNARCLCATHHQYLDANIAEWLRWVGFATYERLQAKANAGIAATGMSPLAFWRDQRAALTEMAKEMDLG